MLDKNIRRAFTKLHRLIGSLPHKDGHELHLFNHTRDLLTDSETALSLHFSGDKEATDIFYRHEHL